MKDWIEKIEGAQKTNEQDKKRIDKNRNIIISIGIILIVSGIILDSIFQYFEALVVIGILFTMFAFFWYLSKIDPNEGYKPKIYIQKHDKTYYLLDKILREIRNYNKLDMPIQRVDVKKEILLLLQELESEADYLLEYAENTLFSDNIKSNLQTLKTIVYSINSRIKYDNDVDEELIDKLVKYANDKMQFKSATSKKSIGLNEAIIEEVRNSIGDQDEEIITSVRWSEKIFTKLAPHKLLITSILEFIIISILVLAVVPKYLNVDDNTKFIGIFIILGITVAITTSYMKKGK